MAATKPPVSKTKKWSEEDLANFILDASLFLSHDTADKKLTRNLNERISPRILGARESPMRVLVDATREIALANHSLMRDALMLILKLPLPRFSTEQLHDLIKLMVLVDFGVGETVVNKMLERLVSDGRARDQATDVGESLVYLAGLESWGGMGSISVVEQLRKHGIASEFISEAALRMVATYNKTEMASAIKILGRDLPKNNLDELKKIIVDISERSTFYAVLAALAALAPTDYPALFRAAFGDRHCVGAFSLFRLDIGSEAPRELMSQYGEQEMFISDFFNVGSSPSVYDWKHSLFDVVGYPPVEPCRLGTDRAKRLVDLRPGLQFESPEVVQGNGWALSQKFARLLHVPICDPNIYPDADPDAVH